MPTRKPKPTPTPPPPVDPPVAETLADAAALWAAVQKHSGEFIAVIDRQGIIRSLNRTDEGVDTDDIVGHSLVRFTTPESTERLLRGLEEVFRTGAEQTMETTTLLPDGTSNYFTIRLGPIVREGRTVAAIAVAGSIRTLKDSEQALGRERTTLRRLIEVQERERQLVSYEIHDGLAQYLAGAMMHFEAFRHTLRGTEPNEFVEGMRLLRAAADESRQLIGGLRPPALDELGIIEAIDSLVADARLEIPEVTFTHEVPARRLPASMETTIFRIVQESLNNCRRHADARSAAILLERTPAGIHLRVSDDGRGFEPGRVPEERFGLEGIRQRCRLLGGEPRIESAPGAGTTIDVVLPE